MDLTDVNTEAPGYHQEAAVPLGSETHAGEDVAVYGQGPGSQMISGTNEQSVVFHVMNLASGLEKDAERAMRAHRGWWSWWKK